MSELSLFCNPYDASRQGFYFASFESLKAQLVATGIEEYAVEFIDGSSPDCDFAKLVEPAQENIEEWFSWLLDYHFLSSDAKLGFEYLMSLRNYDCEDALQQADNVSIFNGSAEDYAYQYMSDCYDIDKMLGSLASYFDYGKLGRDMGLGGDIVELSHNVYVVNANDF